MEKLCLAEWCNKSRHRRSGYCDKHRNRRRKYKSLFIWNGKPITIIDGMEHVSCDSCQNQFSIEGVGATRKFCSRSCARYPDDGHGYVNVLAPEGHSKYDAENPWQCRLPEHHFVMEQAIGRELLPGENVHHKNGIRSDNALSNLELWSVSQPKGQRVDDLISWAVEFLGQYGYTIEEGVN